jgi:regulator of sigma E protease
MLNLVSFVIALGILIFVHELGHFLFAKLFGVGVEKFSLGFGPKIFGKRIGDTEYLVSAIPLGGYVKMVGEGDDPEAPAAEPGRSFAEKSPARRICIVAAGPVFNLIFAYLVYSTILMFGVQMLTAKINVIKDKPAARAGLKDNDLVKRINGKQVRLWDDLATAVIDGKGAPLDITVQRGSDELSFKITPENIKDKNIFSETVSRPAIGVTSTGDTVTENYSPVAAFTKGGVLTWNLTRLTGKLLLKLVSGSISVKDNLGGPLSIADMAGKQAAAGMDSFFLFLAGLSVNLGVLNLLPIPILDGGHVVFNLWELIFRRPVSVQIREVAQKIGLVTLIALMLLAIYLDFDKYLRLWLL